MKAALGHTPPPLKKMLMTVQGESYVCFHLYSDVLFMLPLYSLDWKVVERTPWRLEKYFKYHLSWLKEQGHYDPRNDIDRFVYIL